MIKCNECGFENPDGSDSCLNCGTKLVQPKLSQAMDDISGEATVMLGGGGKNPFAAGAPTAPPPSATSPVTPPTQPPAQPSSVGTPKQGPPPPAAPKSRQSSGLGAGMLFLVVAGGVLVAGGLLFILFRLLGV